MRTSRLLPFAFLAAVLVAACGGTAASSAPASTPAASPSAPSPSASDVGASEEPGGSGAVGIAGFAFGPAEITISAGETVTWTNNDGAPHTVEFDDGSIEGSGNLSQGDTFSATFATAGTFDYVCGIHSNMEGTVIVQ